jgi:nitrogen fixation protein NifB
LNIGPYIKHLAEFDVSHVTITINAVDPEIGSKIYSWIRDGKVIYRGKRAAEILLQRQLDAVEQLKEAGITVKINTIIVPGINEHHINKVAEKIAESGADLQNCMVMYKNAGTPFANLPELSSETVATLRRQAEEIIPQMKHCTRCRADAVGLLDDDKSAEFRSCLSDCSQKVILNETKPFVAVATHEGILVNQHLGEAFRVQIWGETDNEYHYIEDRYTPEAGSGIRRWLELADTLKDCRAVLASGIGATPKHVLEEHGIVPIEMQGLIQTGLETIYENMDVGRLKKRKAAGCSKGMACSGSGDGCG